MFYRIMATRKDAKPWDNIDPIELDSTDGSGDEAEELLEFWKDLMFAHNYNLWVRQHYNYAPGYIDWYISD